VYERLKEISEIFTAVKVVVTAGSEDVSYFFSILQVFVIN